jgi:hypothetical protein
VAIDNYDINYTFAYYDPNRCQNPVLQVPCWDSNDLITRSARLSESDLNSLIWAITKSDFLDLQNSDDYDGRYYPVIIEVHLELGQDSWNKIVVYKSYPGAPERPDSFLLVENTINSVVNLKFRDEYGLPPINTK